MTLVNTPGSPTVESMTGGISPVGFCVSSTEGRWETISEEMISGDISTDS